MASSTPPPLPPEDAPLPLITPPSSALALRPGLAAGLRAALGKQGEQASLALSMAELQQILDATDQGTLDTYIAQAESLRALMDRMKDQAIALRVLNEDPQVAQALEMIEAIRQRTAALRPTGGDSAETQIAALTSIETSTQAARLALLRTQRGEQAAIIEVEAEAFRGETAALTGRHEAERERVNADLSGQREIADARAQGQRALVEAETTRAREVGNDLAVLAGAQRKNTQRVTVEGAIDDARMAVAGARAGRIADEEREEAEGKLDNAKTIERMLSKYISHVGAVAGQGVTAVLSTIGFASMAEERTPVVWGLSAASALAVSSGMFAMIESHMKGGWSFRRNWFAGGAFAGLALVTAGANYGGAVSELRPNGVMVESWTPEDAKGTEFVATAREKLDGLNGTTGTSVAAAVAAGNALVDETLGRGPSGEYGFEKESIKKLAEYRDSLKKEVEALAAANDCEGLEALDANYKAMMDRMQAEKLAKGDAYSKSDFVIGGKYDWDASSQIENCEATHPVSGRDLAAQIESDLTTIRDELAQGTLKDPSKVNPRIATLNQKVKALAGIVDIEEVELKKMDPLMYQAVKVLVESTSSGIDNLLNDAKHNVPYWPFGYLILSLAMDQIGMLFSMLVWVARGNLKEARKEYENYLTRVSEAQLKKEEARLAELSKSTTPATPSTPRP